MPKKLLIVTGPQGSGNHLWSKIFAHSPRVQGWKELTETYWLGHPHEPFSEIWRDPSIFLDLEWPHEYYHTGISCPYVHKASNGSVLDDSKTANIPCYDNFINHAKQAGFEIVIAIITRDKNILEKQQMRLRLKRTTNMFLDQYRNVLLKYNPIHISTESLYLYEDLYLKHISELLDFPIEVPEEKLKEILKDNANAKYIQFVNDYWLDGYMENLSRQQGDGFRYNNPNIYHRPDDDKWKN